MSDRLKVTQPTSLLVFLQAELRQWSRNTIKQRLKMGCVCVNGEAVLQHDFPLAAGDQVEIGASPKGITQSVNQLEILYQDRNLIAINKPAGLLSVANAQETQQHALAILRRQLSHRTPDIKLWPVHRIDRETSGVLLFATSKNIREAVMENWQSAEKIYLAVVEGHPTPPQGTIDQPLRIDEEEYRMHVGEHPNAKVAITHYNTERTSKSRALMKVQLETGRQHQIRAHFTWLGFPIVNDERYGKPGSRMGLHALRLQIPHPTTRKPLLFETPAPKDFISLMTI